MKKFPNAIVIILSVILFAWILTFIIPQGSYERTLNETTELTSVVPDSYQQEELPHLSVFDLLLAIPKGIVGRADLVVQYFSSEAAFISLRRQVHFNKG